MLQPYPCIPPSRASCTPSPHSLLHPPGASIATTTTMTVDESCRSALVFALGTLMHRARRRHVSAQPTCDHATSQVKQSLSPPKSPRTLQPQDTSMLQSVVGDKNIPSMCATPPTLPLQRFSQPETEYVFCAVSGHFAPFSSAYMCPIATGD